MKLTTGQRYYVGAAAVILAVTAGIVIAYPHLPGTIPVHWDAHGRVNGWGPKWSLFVYGPGIMSLIIVLFAAIPWLSPKKFGVDSFRPTYLYLMIVIVSLMAYLEILVLIAALGVVLDVSRAVEGGICLMIALVGNVIGKVRRNFFVGIRTPWTIASEKVWNATHRVAAKTIFAGGVVGLIAVILGAPFWLPITLLIAGPLFPAAYSLVIYKQLERRGELN